jgi:Type II secretion system (T2SS), protein E, N-terminal domain
MLVPVTASAGLAEELSGLFLQTCLPYAGHRAELRLWAAQLKLPEVPDPAGKAFLAGAPGKVFDASISAGKFALLSPDDGTCAVVTDRAADRETARGLERAMGEAGVKFRLVVDEDDKIDPKLHHREYMAGKGGRTWRIIAATVGDDTPSRAMLTAVPQ